MQAADDDIFKLDFDFDFFYDGAITYLLRPASFVFATKQDEQLLAMAAQTATKLQTQIDFVDFAGISTYVQRHSLAARYIASINSRDDLDQLSELKLRAMCVKANVELIDANGVFAPTPSSIMDFLRILDRRILATDIAEGEEIYAAPSRKSMG